MCIDKKNTRFVQFSLYYYNTYTYYKCFIDLSNNNEMVFFLSILLLYKKNLIFK